MCYAIWFQIIAMVGDSRYCRRYDANSLTLFHAVNRSLCLIKSSSCQKICHEKVLGFDVSSSCNYATLLWMKFVLQLAVTGTTTKRDCAQVSDKLKEKWFQKSTSRSAEILKKSVCWPNWPVWSWIAACSKLLVRYHSHSRTDGNICVLCDAL